jgi:hypothetical protein
VTGVKTDVVLAPIWALEYSRGDTAVPGTQLCEVWVDTIAGMVLAHVGTLDIPEPPGKPDPILHPVWVVSGVRWLVR